MHRQRHQSSVMAVAVLASVDTLSILCAFLLAVHDRMSALTTFSESVVQHLPYFLIFALFWFCSAMGQGLFGLWSTQELSARLFSVTKAIGYSLVISTVVMALTTGNQLANEFLLTFCVLTVAFLLLCRLGVRLTVAGWWRRGHNLHRILILGANERTVHLLDCMLSRGTQGYEVVGVLEEEPGRAHFLAPYDVPLLGPIADLEDLLAHESVDEVFISLPVRSSYEVIKDVAHLCEGEGLPVCLLADLFSLRTATSSLMYVEDIPMLSLSTIPEVQWKLALKRSMDVAVSTLLLIALFPAFVLVALAIKLGSPGPIFFAQERVGQNQRRFPMIKFRSMVPNAEALREEVDALNEADGPVFKVKDDPRITPLGKYLRKYSIDEFPQLFNVWLGQMSLVGPRPPLASEVCQYSWDQRRRLSVRPGMTGLWQVSGRSDVGFDEWVELDLIYIDNWSLQEDFIILLKTFQAVYKGRGAS